MGTDTNPTTKQGLIGEQIVFNQKSSEKPVDKSESLKQQIEDLLDHAAQYVIIDEPLIKTIFSLLIDTKKSSTYSFLTAVNKAAEARQFKNNHPLICENLQATCWQELTDLNRLFYCDKSIHDTYAINSDAKEFIQWVFYNYLKKEYEIKIPHTVNLDKKPILLSNQKSETIQSSHPSKPKIEITSNPLISNEEMASLIFMLQDSEITEGYKKEIADRIYQANSMHNANISNTGENEKLPHTTDSSFFKPNISNSYVQEKGLTNFRCNSNGIVEEKNACLYIRGASKITAFNNSYDELKVDNKGHPTLDMSAGVIKGLVKDAVVIYNNEKLKHVDGMITVSGFGSKKTNNTNYFRS